MFDKQTKPPTAHDDGLLCILIDQNDAIQAKIKEADFEVVSTRILQGCIYEVDNFYTGANLTSFKIVPHEAKIIFNERTMLKLIPQLYLVIPEHRFYFKDFNHVTNCNNNNELLSDVFGRIKTIEHLTQLDIAGRLECRRDVIIHNLRGESLTITLLGDVVRMLDDETIITQLPPPVLVVLTSLKTKTYQQITGLETIYSSFLFIYPHIPEADAYKISFNKPKHVATISTSRKLMEEHNQNTLERKTVLDPAIYKDVPVHCKAAINMIITTNGWYYEACPRCFRKLVPKLDSDLLLCPEHDMQQRQLCFRIELAIEDKSDATTALRMRKTTENTLNVNCATLIEERGFKDQNNPPEEILKLKGQIKNLQIKLRVCNDLIIKAIYLDSDLPDSSKKQKR